MKLRLCFYVVLLITLAGFAFAKKGSHHPKWEEILPDIAKEVFPEESRETIDKIFPPQEKSSHKKYKNKHGIEEYYGSTQLSGKVLSPTHIYGEGSLKNVISQEKIEIDNAAIIEKSQIEELTAHSTLKAKASTFKTLRVEDAAILKKCKVLKKLYVEGTLKAEDTTFQGSILTEGSSALLKSCTCQGIRFLSSSTPQTLILENTKINGTIIFEGKAGKVILKKNAKVEGKIKNAKVKTEGDFEEN